MHECRDGRMPKSGQGYHYEHAFALDWNAMKDYHCLMHMAHLFNTLARFARHLKALYAELGVRGAIAFIRQSCAAPWLDPARVRALLSQPFQLQLE
jgi:gamma-glutamylcysteine synthetase